MTKRMCALFISVMILVSLIPAASLAQEGKTQIEFCVGDATLIINGEEVTVETPYVVGEGVTLVPVRVITEAFGAKVGWEADTKTVTLDYPDVNIILQIGNPVAEVNGMAQTLLSPPELTANGFTMVPLRFISENFGATVSYDEATRRIRVIKETSASGTIVEGAIESKYVGDSYYGWRIETPANLTMTERRFDGSRTAFGGDEGLLTVLISPKTDDYDLNEVFSKYKSALNNLTLVKAEKEDSESRQTINIHAKDKEGFFVVREIATDRYIFALIGMLSNADTAARDENLRIAETFNAGYSSVDTYDLSNVENGVRRFESETMKFAVNIPQEFMMISDENVENSFEFLSSKKNDISRISIGIYSKDSVGGAQALAKLDHKNNKENVNEDIAKFDEQVSPKVYKTQSGYEYSYEINATGRNEYNRDFFFELGDYVYNVHVSIQLPNDVKNRTVDAIMNSIEAEMLDSAEIGTIMRNDPYEAEEFTSDKLNRCTLTIPGKYTEVSASKDQIIYSSVNASFGVSVQLGEDITFAVLQEYAKELERRNSKIEGVEVVSSADTVKIGQRKFVKLVLKETEEKDVIYREVYMTAYDSMAYIVSATYMELTYSAKVRAEIEGIIGSMEFK